MIKNFKTKIIFCFFLMFISPIISATTISVSLDSDIISAPYTGDSKRVIATVKNLNNACDISCSWEVVSQSFLDSGTTGIIKQESKEDIPLTLIASGSGSKQFTFSISCIDSARSWPCNEGTTEQLPIQMTFEYCGDDKIYSSTEECDSFNLNSETCLSKGFDGGNLYCSNCKFDSSNCYKCGDGEINSGEDCDGHSFGGKTCRSLGFFAGSLSCNNDCSYDTSGCDRCGDGECSGETCSSCPEDCGCKNGYVCTGGNCEADLTEIDARISEVSEAVDGVSESIQETGGSKLNTMAKIFGIVAAIGSISVAGIKLHEGYNNKKKKKKKVRKKKKK